MSFGDSLNAGQLGVGGGSLQIEAEGIENVGITSRGRKCTCLSGKAIGRIALIVAIAAVVLLGLAAIGTGVGFGIGYAVHAFGWKNVLAGATVIGGGGLLLLFGGGFLLFCGGNMNSRPPDRESRRIAQRTSVRAADDRYYRNGGH